MRPAVVTAIAMLGLPIAAQAQAPEHLDRRRGRLGLGQPEEPGDHAQVLEPGHRRLDRGVLTGQADAATHLVRVGRDIDAGDLGPVGGFERFGHALAAGDFDGVFLSNGPGDPATADSVVRLTEQVLGDGTPLFGICFGNQILGRALGRSTYKMVFGHRGINVPVIDHATGR